MKIKLISIIAIIVISIFNTSQLKAQVSNNDVKTTNNQKLIADFNKALIHLRDNSKLVGENEPCLEQFIQKVKKSIQPVPKADDPNSGPGEFVTGFIKKLVSSADLKTISFEIDKGDYKTITDKALSALSGTENFLDFNLAFTGKNIGDISKEDMFRLRLFYSQWKIFQESTVVYINSYDEDGCYATNKFFLKVIKFNYPNIEYKFSGAVLTNCKCESKNHENVKSGFLVYDSTVSGILTSTVQTLNTPQNPTATIESISCCEGEKEEETSITLPENENISLPEQTIGLSAGMGFAQEFEETSICIGAEYLYNIKDFGKCDLYVGANAQFETTSFMDFNNTWVGIGPTAQLFTPISHNGDTQMTNGIGANYIFGTNDNNGLKDDISGYEISLNTGINVQLNENLSLSLIIPVLTHQSLTYEAQEGSASFETNDTTILVNKGNPVKIGLRFGF